MRQDPYAEYKVIGTISNGWTTNFGITSKEPGTTHHVIRNTDLINMSLIAF